MRRLLPRQHRLILIQGKYRTQSKKFQLKAIRFQSISVLEKSHKGHTNMTNRTEFKNPFEWMDDEIHELVVKEVGEDTVFPRGYHVLMKLWMPPKTYDSGFERTEHGQRNERI